MTATQDFPADPTLDARFAAHTGAWRVVLATGDEVVGTIANRPTTVPDVELLLVDETVSVAFGDPYTRHWAIDLRSVSHLTHA